MNRVAQYRMLVANDQRRIDELAAAMESMGIEDLTPAWLVRCEEAQARLQHHQRLLAVHLLAHESLNPSPAAPAAPQATLAGALPA